ncbi:hypothetical protein AMECASPLE_028832 [Ameca splendens]|uniref:RHD domain-containing protein n=1 Tax=Ameca splendens TaxID=208324 RepID=A0ABV0YH08_9TELE
MESEPLTLQLFIGTADDRLLRPHAFYQVHRITGKTVSTPSHEILHNNTKVLEIPLLPENNMRAIIDCAGILKLRNSDIELRKGETDIGRKNTRVRMVFRVHVNQSNSRTVSLQVASNPIECSQRSAQELPLVDKQSLEKCPAPGGERMILDGHNFQHDSKVVFVEKAQGTGKGCSCVCVCPSLCCWRNPRTPPPSKYPPCCQRATCGAHYCAVFLTQQIHICRSFHCLFSRGMITAECVVCVGGCARDVEQILMMCVCIVSQSRSCFGSEAAATAPRCSAEVYKQSFT